MKTNEMFHLIVSFIVLSLVISLPFALKNDWNNIPLAFLISAIILIVNVGTKKLMAFSLDSRVEHKIWKFSRFGFKPEAHFRRELPFGIIIPLLLSIASLGYVKCMSLLTYETYALKARAAKRFGYYSYTEMTEWENGLIGAAGIVAVLLLSLISYLVGFELISKMAAFYAFWNVLPIPQLDGTQIFFGSRILWITLFLITLIFAIYGLAITI